MLSRCLLPIALTLWIGASHAAVNAELQAKLLQMGAQDQSVREKKLAAEMAAVDSKNIAELELIVQQFGWPGSDLVGDEASRAAFLILQHAPLARQKILVAILRQAVNEGQARAADLALLEDRILVGEGKNQVYGSQITAGPDGVPRLHPIEDPDNVNVRRKAVGLPPLEDYLEFMEQKIGKPIER